MKFVLFGGFLFIGGAIMYSAISPVGISINEFRGGYGIVCMLVGTALGIFGLIKKDDKKQ